jgi:CpeT protein
MRTFFLAAICFVSVAATAQQKLNKDDAKRLKDRMIGSYDSQEQAGADNSYQNIVLNVGEFDLRKKFDLKKKKRVYQLYRQDEMTIVAKVYELPEPQRFAGAWNDAGMMKKLTKDSLIGREGCTIYFHKNDDGNYYGNTDGKGCESSLEGASYSSTELNVFPNMVILWERGYDSGDNQVWGADKAGYRLRKWVQLRKPKD